MPRRRLAVALLVDRASSLVIDQLRRGLGASDEDVARIPPHLTLVPPQQVPTPTVPDVWEEVRLAARRVDGPVDLDLGPIGTFAPRTPTIHLVVAPDPALDVLAEAGNVPALARSGRFGFVPHVTLRPDADEARIRASVDALEDFRMVARARRLWLMQFQPTAGLRGRWEPVGDVSLGPARERTVGSATLEIATSVTRGPSALALMREALDRDDLGVAPPLLVHPDGRARVIAARVGPHVVGVAEVSWHEGVGLLHYLYVGPGHRGEGIGRALVRETIDLMASHWALRLDARVTPDLPPALLEAYGFAPADPGTWRITLAN